MVMDLIVIDCFTLSSIAAYRAAGTDFGRKSKFRASGT